MKNLIYQVYLGGKTHLYNHCTNSVKEYAKQIGADYKILTIPKLRIKPDPFRTGRKGKCGGWEKHGYMPIFEKENIFEYFKEYDNCCVIDSDIYVRPGSPNIFEEIGDSTVASVYECDLPITTKYRYKIKQYSESMCSFKRDVKWNHRPDVGVEFFNSGVMLYNSKKMLKVLNGMNAKQFLEQACLKDWIDGVGPLKWQSDQMTLNYWFLLKNIRVKHLNWKYNTLFTAIPNNKTAEGYFIHFFLKDLLPNRGENVEDLMRLI